MQNYTLEVFKKDGRTKSGERWVKSYSYENTSAEAMAAEVRDLRQDLYRAVDGWRLEWHATTVQVVSLASGRPVEIAYAHVGTAQDPSQERYWSL